MIDIKILKDQAAYELKINLSKIEKQKALNTLMSVSFDQFMSQVHPYLTLEYQDIFKNKEAWNKIQTEVVEFIESHPAGKL